MAVLFFHLFCCCYRCWSWCCCWSCWWCCCCCCWSSFYNNCRVPRFEPEILRSHTGGLSMRYTHPFRKLSTVCRLNMAEVWSFYEASLWSCYPLCSLGLSCIGNPIWGMVLLEVFLHRVGRTAGTGSPVLIATREIGCFKFLWGPFFTLGSLCAASSAIVFKAKHPNVYGWVESWLICW